GAAAHARAEERLRKAAVRAFGQWTSIVSAAVLDGRGLTAAPEPTDQTDQTAQPPAASTAPDPYAASAVGEAWGGIAESTIVAAVDQLLGEAFAEHLVDPETPSARAWAEDYLAGVSNRLAGIPNQTFDQLRGELQAGHDTGESIPQL